jgi:hypothetical protein
VSRRCYHCYRAWRPLPASLSPSILMAPIAADAQIAGDQIE